MDDGEVERPAAPAKRDKVAGESAFTSAVTAAGAALDCCCGLRDSCSAPRGNAAAEAARAMNKTGSGSTGVASPAAAAVVPEGGAAAPARWCRLLSRPMGADHTAAPAPSRSYERPRFCPPATAPVKAVGKAGRPARRSPCTPLASCRRWSDVGDAEGAPPVPAAEKSKTQRPMQRAQPTPAQTQSISSAALSTLPPLPLPLLLPLLR